MFLLPLLLAAGQPSLGDECPVETLAYYLTHPVDCWQGGVHFSKFEGAITGEGNYFGSLDQVLVVPTGSAAAKYQNGEFLVGWKLVSLGAIGVSVDPQTISSMIELTFRYRTSRYDLYLMDHWAAAGCGFGLGSLELNVHHLGWWEGEYDEISNGDRVTGVDDGYYGFEQAGRTDDAFALGLRANESEPQRFESRFLENSETARVIVTPEPAAAILTLTGLVAVAVAATRSSKRKTTNTLSHSRTTS